MKVIILSGIPGSGKTTWFELNHAGKDQKEVAVVSADKFFVNPETGEYEFNPSKLAENHSNCFNLFLDHLSKKDTEILVVDNTNLQSWERQNYIKAAQMAGVDDIEVHFFIPDSIADLKVITERNVHGVPAGTVALMAMNQDSRIDMEFEGVVKARYRYVDTK